MNRGYVIILSVIFVLPVCEVGRGLPVMDIALSDPEGDTFLTNNTVPANFSILKNVSGYPEIDIRRAGSALKGQEVTLFMHLYGQISEKAVYYFLVRTTGAGGIWGLYDLVIESKNSSTMAYFATSSKYQDLKDARSFDLNRSSVRKGSELYATITLELLRDPPSFQISAVSFLPGNKTGYADWTKNANPEGEDGSGVDTALITIGIAACSLIVIYAIFSRRGKNEKNTIVCRWCGRRYERGMLYCPGCGREPGDKKPR